MIDPQRRALILQMCHDLEGTDNSACFMQKQLGIFPLTIEEQDLMDDHIFQCPGCGWWCHSDEMVDGQCQDCYEEELGEQEHPYDDEEDEYE